jgi:hypothetical protein
LLKVTALHTPKSIIHSIFSKVHDAMSVLAIPFEVPYPSLSKLSMLGTTIAVETEAIENARQKLTSVGKSKNLTERKARETTSHI